MGSTEGGSAEWPPWVPAPCGTSPTRDRTEERSVSPTRVASESALSEARHKKRLERLDEERRESERQREILKQAQTRADSLHKRNIALLRAGREVASSPARSARSASSHAPSATALSVTAPSTTAPSSSVAAFTKAPSSVTTSATPGATSKSSQPGLESSRSDSARRLSAAASRSGSGPGAMASRSGSAHRSGSVLSTATLKDQGLTGDWVEVWEKEDSRESEVGRLALWQEGEVLHGTHTTESNPSCTIRGSVNDTVIQWTFVEWNTSFEGSLVSTKGGTAITGTCTRSSNDEKWVVKFQRKKAPKKTSSRLTGVQSKYLQKQSVPKVHMPVERPALKKRILSPSPNVAHISSPKRGTSPATTTRTQSPSVVRSGSPHQSVASVKRVVPRTGSPHQSVASSRNPRNLGRMPQTTTLRGTSSGVLSRVSSPARTSARVSSPARTSATVSTLNSTADDLSSSAHGRASAPAQPPSVRRRVESGSPAASSVSRLATVVNRSVLPTTVQEMEVYQLEAFRAAVRAKRLRSAKKAQLDQAMKQLKMLGALTRAVQQESNKYELEEEGKKRKSDYGKLSENTNVSEGSTKEIATMRRTYRELCDAVLDSQAYINSSGVVMDSKDMALAADVAKGKLTVEAIKAHLTQTGSTSADLLQPLTALAAATNDALCETKQLSGFLDEGLLLQVLSTKAHVMQGYAALDALE